MTQYEVRWVILIEAESELEAARKAKEIQLDPKTIANTFSVQESSRWFDPERTIIDLNDIE